MKGVACRTIFLASARLLPQPRYLGELRSSMMDPAKTIRVGCRSVCDCVARKSAFIGFPQIWARVLQSMRAGIWIAKRNGLELLDADGSIPPYEVLRVLSLLQEENAPDGFFASRCKILGRTVHRSWLRHVCGRVFATLVATATGIPVYDSQCGFKLIKRDAYEAISSRLREKRFAFDVELLVALRRSGAKVIEVPIDWCDVPGSKLHFVRDTAQMLAAVIGMRMRRDLTIHR